MVCNLFIQRVELDLNNLPISCLSVTVWCFLRSSRINHFVFVGTELFCHTTRMPHQADTQSFFFSQACFRWHLRWMLCFYWLDTYSEMRQWDLRVLKRVGGTVQVHLVMCARGQPASVHLFLNVHQDCISAHAKCACVRYYAHSGSRYFRGKTERFPRLLWSRPGFFFSSTGAFGSTLKVNISFSQIPPRVCVTNPSIRLY